MRTNIGLSIVACAALASCANPSGERERAPSTYAPTACIEKGELNTCIPGADGQPTKCHVFVVDRGRNPAIIYPGILHTPGPAASSPVIIVWHLSGSTFRDKTEGPDLGDKSYFSGGTPTGGDGDEEASGKSPHFRFKFANTHAVDQKYNLKFVNSGGVAMSCDPRITNSGG